MRRYRIGLLLVLLAILAVSVVAVFAYSCRGGERTVNPQRDTTPYDGSLRATSQISSLDDPGNPYRDKYEEWDSWIYNHVVGVTDKPDNSFVLSRKPGEFVMPALVDRQGYMLPYREYVRQEELAIREHRLQESTLSYRWAYATGPMDQTLVDKARQAAWDVKAQFYAHIPDWVVDNPPRGAILMPNGDVVTQGPLGSGKVKSAPGGPDTQPKEGCCGGTDGDGYYRFSADGEPLGFTGGFWWLLYYDAEVNGMPDGRLDQREDGYFIFKDPGTDQIIAVYDYTGENLGTQVPPLRDPHSFSLLKTGVLRQIFYSQRRLGI